MGDRERGGCGGGLGESCTTKDVAPWEPLAREKSWPKPGAAHSAPFQPSPHESVISRVHVAPSAATKGTLATYGAPPLSVVPSEQLRLQPTSLGYDPREQVITEEMVMGGDGGGGGEDRSAEGERHSRSTSRSRDVPMEHATEAGFRPKTIPQPPCSRVRGRKREHSTPPLVELYHGRHGTMDTIHAPCQLTLR